MLVLALLTARGAECSATQTNEDLVVALTQAMQAYGELDRTGFEAGLRKAKSTVDCLDEVIDSAAAAELHRATGLSAFLARDEDLAKTRFAAARALEPAYTFPDTVVPTGNAVHDLYQALDPTSSPIESLAAPAEGSIRLDGVPSRDRKTLLPVVFQRLDGSGAVAASTLLSPGLPPPSYAAAPVESGPAETRRKKGPNVPLLIVAGVAAAGAIGTFAGSHASRSGYVTHVQAGGTNPEFTDTANARRTTTNVLAASAVGLGVVGLGTGAVAVFTGSF